MLGLVGCVVGPDFAKPEFELPQKFTHEGMLWKQQKPQAMPASGRWWDIYRDATLTQLIERALKQNQSVEAASARLAQARATSKAARSLYFPNITLGQDSRRTKSVFRGPQGGSIYYSSLEVPLDFRYELDVWGKVRRQVEGAKAREAAAEETLRALKLTLAGDVAQTYWALRAVDADRELFHRTLELRRKALELIGKQRDAGAISDLDYARAEAEVAAAEADRIELDQRRVELINALAVLTGRIAGGGEAMDRHELPEPPSIPTKLPSEVLQQRPDIRAALHHLAAANADIGVASAVMYPSLTINASAGVESSEWDSLFRSDALVWSLGSNILLPLTSQKLYRHQREAVEQAHRALTAEYRQAVIESIAEVETVLQSASILEQRHQAQQKAVKAARSTYDKSLKRYESGLVSFLDVVDAERTLLAAERKANAIRADSLALSVSLIKSIGGRW